MKEFKEFRLADADETAALGASIAAALRARAGLVVYLEGPLGAGKTTLARGLLRALGATGTIRSPTYTLLEPYELGAGRNLIHLDLYRLKGVQELEPLGLRDYDPADCWWLVEWPERGVPKLPAADLRVVLATEGEGRRAQLSGPAAIQVKP
jgi:tRNA threonylcarbamoyladenosine biosynthesis protein TsaE